MADFEDGVFLGMLIGGLVFAFIFIILPGPYIVDNFCQCKGFDDSVIIDGDTFCMKGEDDNIELEKLIKIDGKYYLDCAVNKDGGCNYEQ